MERGRHSGHDPPGLGKALRRLELTLRVDDLGAALALGFGLAGHGALHALGQLDVLDLDDRHLHPPGLGLLIDDLLKAVVDLLTFREERVQLGLSEDAAQGGLRNLRCGADMVGDVHDGGHGVQDVEVDDRVYAHGDVVFGDRLLARHVHRDRTQIDLHHPLDDRDDDEEAGTARALQTAETEDDTSFVLLDDADGERREGDQKHVPQPGQDGGHESSH